LDVFLGLGAVVSAEPQRLRQLIQRRSDVGPVAGGDFVTDVDQVGQGPVALSVAS